jgi:hypothetical protein
MSKLKTNGFNMITKYFMVYSSQNLPCLKEGWECTNPMRPITLKALCTIFNANEK